MWDKTTFQAKRGSSIKLASLGVITMGNTMNTTNVEVKVRCNNADATASNFHYEMNYAEQVDPGVLNIVFPVGGSMSGQPAYSGNVTSDCAAIGPGI